MADDFFKTRMGARFYEHSVPEIATQLKRIADALEGDLALRKQEYNLAVDKHMNEQIARDHVGHLGCACPSCLGARSAVVVAGSTRKSETLAEMAERIGLKTVVLRPSSDDDLEKLLAEKDESP